MLPEDSENLGWHLPGGEEEAIPIVLEIPGHAFDEFLGRADLLILKLAEIRVADVQFGR